ncbi:MAG TPA: hypothetical protein DCM27_05195 [Rhodospirillaceae bacterium]|nr:hypothetical protein [Rhodospirillaceae bacterium]
MNQNEDFSEFTQGLQAIIDNGRDEAAASKNSLERMRLSAIREGRHDDASRITELLNYMKNEIAFFRALNRIGTTEKKGGWISRLTAIGQGNDRILPDNFEKITFSASRPFQSFEGIFKDNAAGASPSLKGPFLIAVAANFSEAVDLPQEPLVCLFNQATNGKAGNNQAELRVWGLKAFAERFGGKSFDQSVLTVPPDANETILELTRGTPDQLFRVAVGQMVRASLSHNPPEAVQEQFFAALKDYAGTSPAP